MSWGAPLSAANNYNYSPKDDYFQTGIIGTESISLSTGTEKKSDVCIGCCSKLQGDCSQQQIQPLQLHGT
ncbi:hypothetical protein NIB75_22115 [Bacteroides uniformis]|nr:hypothetical protein [Bacteroides uniformis]